MRTLDIHWANNGPIQWVFFIHTLLALSEMSCLLNTSSQLNTVSRHSFAVILVFYHVFGTIIVLTKCFIFVFHRKWTKEWTKKSFNFHFVPFLSLSLYFYQARLGLKLKRYISILSFQIFTSYSRIRPIDRLYHYSQFGLIVVALNITK